jgi:chromosome partitioning protein
MASCKYATMKTVAVIAQKGGSGKTTVVINLAGAADELGRLTVVVDLDPQASAKGWHDHRRQKTPIVISAQANRLDDVLGTAREHGADLAIVDTGPASETAALAAARAADLILIPCRPSILDLRAISSSVDLVQIAKRPALLVLNAVPPRGGLAAQAVEAVAVYGIPVAEARIGQRAAFVHSLTSGQTVCEYEPNGAAASEIRALLLDSMITCNRDRGSA